MKKKILLCCKFFEQRRAFLFGVIYSLLFVCIAVVTFSAFLIKRNSFIIYGDGFNQYYPVLVYACARWVDFLENPFLAIRQFDFSIGFGEPVLTVLITHGLGNALNILSLLVNKEHMVDLYGCITILSIYLSGLSFSSYCFYHQKSMRATIAGALTYAFSVYSLVDSVQFVIFLYPMMILPLILVGIDQVMDSNNPKLISKSLVISVFIQALSGYYFLYMETIILVAYIVIKYWTCAQRHALPQIIKRTVWVGLQYLIGLMMGAIVFVPSVVGFFNSSRTVGQYYGLRRFLLYSQQTYLSYLKNIIVPNGFEISLGLPILCIICIVCICCGKLIRHRLFLIVSIIGMFVPLISYIMNGFVFTNYRGIFASFFLWSYILVYVYDDILNMKKSIYIIAFSIIFTSLMLNLIIGHFDKEVCIRVAYYVILLIFCIYICLIRQRKKTDLVMLFLIINLCVNGIIINGPRIIGGTGLSANFLKKDSISENFEQSIFNSIPKSEEFYRVDIRDASLNTAQVLDYNGTVEYFSMVNGYVAEFFRELSIYPGYSSPYALLGLDGRSILESLLSVKYYTENAGEEITTGVVQNEDMLPLGYTYDCYIDRKDFLKLDLLDRSDAMMQAVILEEPLSSRYNESEGIVSHSKCIPSSIELFDIEAGENIKVNRNSIIRVSTEVPSEKGELYLYFKGCSTAEIDVLELYMNVDGKEIAFNDYNYNSNGVLVKVDAESGLKKDILITFSDAGELQLDSINTYWYSKEDFANQISKLEENTLNQLNFPPNRVQGEISLNEDKILFLSIPFDKGWKAYVDGKEEMLYRANIAFMAIPLARGEHIIELRYTTPGILCGFIFSVIGIVIFLIWCIISYKVRRRNYGEINIIEMEYER